MKICRILHVLYFSCCGLLLAGALMLSACGSALADSGGSLPESGSDPWQIVVSDIAGQVVALLPEDAGFRVLGIGEIEGDDNTLAEALTAAIKSATRFHLMERADLQKLLTEQGIQLGPIMDPRSVVEPGQIKGIEGLLLGRIVKKVQTPLYSSIQVFLKLDNVETGSVVFARTFEASYIPAMTWYLGFGLAALFLLLLLRGRSRRRKQRFLATYSEKEAAQRQAIEAQLKKCRDNLHRAHELLGRDKGSEAAVRVREIRQEVAGLLQKLQLGPVVHPENVDQAMVRELEKQNKTMKELVDRVYAASEKILENARRGVNVEPVLDTLANRLKDAANAAYDRQQGVS